MGFANVLCGAMLGLLLALPPAAPAYAQNQAAQQELRAAIAAARKAQIDGPADVKLADQAVLKLPADELFIPAAEAGRLLRAMGNSPGDALLGMALRPGEDWFVVVRFVKSGYVKDDDARDWNADELLANIRSGTAEANKQRRARGFPEMQVVGWVQAPAYDAGTHRLVWSVQSKDANDAPGAEHGINYNTYALGREGYISMNLVTGMSSVQADKPHVHRLLAALHFNDGKRYADFDSSTDHMAEFGLAALVGGIAAKKLGLFALIAALAAKFAKVIGVAALALGAGVAKVLKRRA